jgi:ubiquinone/menaquinone biosynthesis C-methylase UbiE
MPESNNWWNGYVEDAYSRLDSGEIKSEFQRLVQPFLKRPPRRVLDVGTGPGHFLVTMRDLAPEAMLHGTDASYEHLARARIDLARRGVSAALIRSNSMPLPYPDRYFDLVICQAVMPYSYDDRRFLEGLLRVLRPGGVLWFATHGIGFYVVRMLHRTLHDRVRYGVSVVSGLLSMMCGWKPINDTPVTVGWLRRALRRAGCQIHACEWSQYGALPQLIRATAVKAG